MPNRRKANLPTAWVCAAFLAISSMAGAQPNNLQTRPATNKRPTVRAEINLSRHLVLPGSPVEATVSLFNAGDKIVGLTPISSIEQESPTTRPSPVHGISYGQLFGSDPESAIMVKDASTGRFLDTLAPIGAEDHWPVSILPNGITAIRLDLSRHFRGLHKPGKYEIVWRPPFHDPIEPARAVVSVERKRIVVLSTEYGLIRLRLFYDDAPRHVANFLELVDLGFYDNLTFHRVRKDLMIQGGDPAGDGGGKRPDGKRLNQEINTRRHTPGALSIACVPGNPNSGSCQFYICLGREPTWDGLSTVFGECIDTESLDAARRIGGVVTDDHGKPLSPVKILRATTRLALRPTSRPVSRPAADQAGRP